MTRKFMLVCAGAALAVSMGAGCSKKGGETEGPAKDKGAAAAPAAPVVKTVSYKAPDGSFTIDLPEQFKEMTVTSQKASADPNAPSMATYMAGSEKDKIMFMVASVPAAGMQAADLTKALEDSLKGMAGDGTILKQSEVTIDGNKGIQARVKKTQGADTIIMEWEEVFINNTMYQISMISDDEKKLDTPEAKAFMTSFKSTAAAK